MPAPIRYGLARRPRRLFSEEVGEGKQPRLASSYGGGLPILGNRGPAAWPPDACNAPLSRPRNRIGHTKPGGAGTVAGGAAPRRFADQPVQSGHYAAVAGGPVTLKSGRGKDGRD